MVEVPAPEVCIVLPTHPKVRCEYDRTVATNDECRIANSRDRNVHRLTIALDPCQGYGRTLLRHASTLRSRHAGDGPCSLPSPVSRLGCPLRRGQERIRGLCSCSTQHSTVSVGVFRHHGDQCAQQHYSGVGVGFARRSAASMIPRDQSTSRPQGARRDPTATTTCAGVVVRLWGSSWSRARRN